MLVLGDEEFFATRETVHFPSSSRDERPWLLARAIAPRRLDRTSPTGVPGFFCTSGVDTNWDQRSGMWHAGKSIVLSRS